jgi:uracil-DNA glycosylase family 4
MRDQLRRLAGEIRACRRCPALGGGYPGNGPENAKVAFVGEAPGRLGCGRTGVPFAGDRSGANFSRLLEAAGLRREEVFVTNAVHCLPLSRDGRNRRPLRSEMGACRGHLLRELALLRPRIVVTLGAVALAAVTGRVPRRLREEVGRVRRVGALAVFPAYHPSPRVAGTARSLAAQAGDFVRLGRWLRRR